MNANAVYTRVSTDAMLKAGKEGTIRHADDEDFPGQVIFGSTPRPFSSIQSYCVRRDSIRPIPCRWAPFSNSYASHRSRLNGDNCETSAGNHSSSCSSSGGSPERRHSMVNPSDTRKALAFATCGRPLLPNCQCVHSDKIPSGPYKRQVTWLPTTKTKHVC